MYLSVIQLANYRNFEQAEFAFDKDRTAICGENARGKSNLLEAIYFLAIAKSGRGAKDRDVVRWGADYFSIDAVIERDGRPFPVRVAYDSRVGKKKAYLETTPLPRLAALIGTFNAVLFSPEDVDLVLRDPPQRRRLLDILVSQSNVSYLSDLEDYRRTLAQRNRLLKDHGRQLLSDPGQLAPWDAQLADLGARVIRYRLEALDEIQPLIETYCQKIAATSEHLQASYRSPVSFEKRDQGREILIKAYQDRRREEIEQGFTLCGPHRDNLIFQLDGRAAHQFASKGQLKSVLLAWKLAEASFLASRTGRQPVLLMDDIFSELDRKRSYALLDLMASFGQIVMTSARDPDLKFEEQGFRVIEL
ncbi:MAG: DNA replication/repair protein RecF [bacterium]|nr:DNA replication/repair protein RecF [bacterium]